MKQKLWTVFLTALLALCVSFGLAACGSFGGDPDDSGDNGDDTTIVTPGNPDDEPGTGGNPDDEPGTGGNPDDEPGTPGDPDEEPGTPGDPDEEPGTPGDPDDEPGTPGDPDDEPETPHEHTYTSAVTKEPTCTQEGEMTYTCTCGESYTEPVAMIPHTEVIDEAVAPSCTQTGLTEGKHCSVCGTVLVEQEVVPMTQHTYTSEVTREPSCDHVGERTYTCTCGDSYTKPIAMIPHTEVIDAAVAPTCTKTGLTEGKHCSVCGTVLVKQEVIPMTAHNYVDGVCTMCGKPDESYATEGLVFTLSDDGTCYSVTDYTGAATEVHIPAVYKGLPVTSIGDEAFYRCSSLTNITISDSVTSIGESAFEGCSSLTSITIPDGVTSIGDYAFYNCSKLTSITIPDSVTSIGSSAFSDTAYYNDEGNWENDVLYIGNHLIKARITLSGDYIIRQGTKTIAEIAFYNCIGLTSITIPEEVISIGEEMFVVDTVYGGYNLASITVASGNPVYHSEGNCLIETDSKTLIVGCNNSVIPTDGSVARIGDRAFHNCNSLTSIEIPDSVTSIGESAFYHCNRLTSVIIGNGVTSIGSSAFSSCYSLISVEIPDSVTSIGESAFYYCSSLTSIEIPDSVTSIGERAFYHCSSLTSIEIPDSVTSIGDFAFSSCNGLINITIPDSVIIIGNGVFSYCDNLETITVASGNPVYHSAGNCLIETDSKTLILGCKSSIIPTDGSVTSIEDWAFSGCSGLTSITIPDGVTSIGEYAFSGCSSLISVTIADSVTSIGWYAFSDCSDLTSVIFSDSSKLTSIGVHVFANCDSLTSITIPNSVTSIGDKAFYNCNSLTSIIIPDSVTSIGRSAFYGCERLTSVTFEDPEGWYRTTSEGSIYEWILASSDLSNPATAAEYLTSTYWSYYWYKR